jgi:rhodanese-related sulfurtransferase
MKTVFITGIAVMTLFTSTSCGTNPTESSASSSGVTSEAPAQQKASVKNIKPADVAKITKEESAIIVDVRTPGEVSEGVIEGASMFIDYNGGNFESEIAKLDKSKTYIVYCRSGARSANASGMMVNNGFQHIYNLEGGIMGWTGNVVKK